MKIGAHVGASGRPRLMQHKHWSAGKPITSC